MRRFQLAIVFVAASSLIVFGGWLSINALLRAPSWQAVRIAYFDQQVREETYDRALQALQGSRYWLQRHQTISEIGLLHYNVGRQERDVEKRDAFYGLSLEAFNDSLRLSPLQPTAWAIVALMLDEQGLRDESAAALDWSMKTGYFVERLREGRTVLGLALWDAVTDETRDRLMHSIVPTFRRAPEIVTEGAVGAGIVDDLAERFAAWPSEDQDEDLEAKDGDYGSVLAAEFAVAAESLKQARLDRAGGETDDMRRLYAALAILTASNVPLLAEAMTIDQYLSVTRGEDELRSPDSVNDYLIGVLDALLVLGDFNKRGGEPLFCMPRQDLLNYDVIYFRATLDSMLEQMEREMPEFDTLSKTRSIGLASLQLLSFLHPCETEPEQAEAPG